ncbi:hypothetical protein LAUMK42_01157 [Mycobacterium persicum]|uniref:Uncharacterized protein n=1 Tax=Mycobacterium persicum TaxID=1487726 RepID=A0AB38UNW7_9MYCO|nr:hypothetical protein LAUMK42_01157 [Mycobacterium persicum]
MALRRWRMASSGQALFQCPEGLSLVADGAECALAAPTVLWRRRLCRQGGPLAAVPALHTQSKPSPHTRCGGMTADSVGT